MKTLYIECNMGAAGDMLMAALLELIPEKELFLEKINALGLAGVRVDAVSSVKCGITGTHIFVTVNGAGRDYRRDTQTGRYGKYCSRHRRHKRYAGSGRSGAHGGSFGQFRYPSV
jgi:uncharacterized protein (DUF111 family)